MFYELILPYSSEYYNCTFFNILNDSIKEVKKQKIRIGELVLSMLNLNFNDPFFNIIEPYYNEISQINVDYENKIKKNKRSDINYKLRTEKTQKIDLIKNDIVYKLANESNSFALMDFFNRFLALLIPQSTSYKNYIETIQKETEKKKEKFIKFVDEGINDISIFDKKFFNYLCSIDYFEPALLKLCSKKVDNIKEVLTLKANFDSLNDNNFYYTFVGGSGSIYACDLQLLLSKGYIIKKCQNCGKYFVPYNRSDTIYCDGKAPQNSTKSCKEYASQDLYYQKTQSNPVSKLYRNIYQQKQMLSKRNPDIEEYKANFENFKSAAKEWKNKIKRGLETEENYLQWLKDVKEKKVKPNGNNT